MRPAAGRSLALVEGVISVCWTRPASPAEVIVYLFPRSHYDRLQPYASPEVPAASAQASMPKTDRSVCQVLGVPLESIYLKSFSPRPQQTPRCATSNKLKQGRVLLHHLGPPEECGPGFALCLPSFRPDLPLHSKDLLQQLIDSPPRAQRVKRQSRQAFETAPGFVNPKFFCVPEPCQATAADCCSRAEPAGAKCKSFTAEFHLNKRWLEPTSAMIVFRRMCGGAGPRRPESRW